MRLSGSLVVQSLRLCGSLVVAYTDLISMNFTRIIMYALTLRLRTSLLQRCEASLCLCGSRFSSAFFAFFAAICSRSRASSSVDFVSKMHKP